MHVITRRRLREFWKRHPQAQSPMKAWFHVASKATWNSHADVRSDFPYADYVPPYVVFDVGGDNYRVIAKIEYTFGKEYILHVFTHAEYDRWKP